MHRPGSFIEIAWILLKYRREYGTSKECSCDRIGVSGSEPPGITLRTLSKSSKSVGRLPHSRSTRRHDKVDRVGLGLPCKLELLLSGKRGCDRVVGNIEIRNCTEYTLPLLVLDIRLCEFFL